MREYALVWCSAGTITMVEERADFKLAEQVSYIPGEGVTDKVYNNASKILGEKKPAQVIFNAFTIKRRNRIAIPMHMIPEMDYFCYEKAKLCSSQNLSPLFIVFQKINTDKQPGRKIKGGGWTAINMTIDKEQWEPYKQNIHNK